MRVELGAGSGNIRGEATENAHASIDSTRWRTILSRTGFVQQVGRRPRIDGYVLFHRRLPAPAGAALRVGFGERWHSAQLLLAEK
jgi:hypothetical protein